MAEADAPGQGVRLALAHRVIRASGPLGGYAWGVARKRALIGREAASRDLMAAG